MSVGIGVTKKAHDENRVLRYGLVVRFKSKFVESWDAIANLLLRLKTLSCPHCGAHGYFVNAHF